MEPKLKRTESADGNQENKVGRHIMRELAQTGGHSVMYVG